MANVKRLTPSELFVRKEVKGFIRRPGRDDNTVKAFMDKVNAIAGESMTVVGVYDNINSRYTESHKECLIDGVKVKLVCQQGWGEPWLYIIVNNKKEYDKVMAKINN